uniref:Ig-like domain-containing protein n=1 Tax=Astyanax mexicanus TaxID=7994 RepID=A0A8B9J541_ASTMX
ALKTTCDIYCFLYCSSGQLFWCENISLSCSFSSPEESSTAWFKQTPGEKPILISSAYHSGSAEYHNGFDKSGRFIASRQKNSFTLNILNAEPSDSATYFYWTVSVIKGQYAPSSLYTVLQPPVSDPVQLGGNTTLQCSILTDNSAGDHSVYWFRHGSGESDPGIIFTHGNRSDQCKKSSETVSPTQSCIYKLPKNNLSLSDAGTYYCARVKKNVCVIYCAYKLLFLNWIVFEQ